MQHWIKLSIALLALSISTPAFAAGDHYIGTGIGTVSISNGINKSSAFIGYLKLGHHFSEYLSAEIHLAGSGNTGDDTSLQPKQRIDYVAHYIKPQYEIMDGLTAYGLVGFAVVHSSRKPLGIGKQSKTRIGYAYGLGLSYLANEDYSINIEATHMLSKPKNTAATINTQYKGVEANTLTGAIQYHF